MSPLERLMEAVERWAGIRLDAAASHAPLEALLAQRALEAGLPPAAYLDGLEGDAGARQALLDTLTVNYTWFDRDPALLREVVRALADQPAPRRVWVPGCSTGEDVYTLAMLTHQAGLEVDFLGTDLNTANVAAARAGAYGAWSLRELPTPLRLAYLIDGNGRAEIAPAVRARCTFERHNLLEPPPPGAFGLVFCRNVLIYFSLDTASRVRTRLGLALRPGGYLVQGASEPVLGPEPGLQVARLGPRVAWRRTLEGEAATAPPLARAPASHPPLAPLGPPAPPPSPPPLRDLRRVEHALHRAAGLLQRAPAEALPLLEAVREADPLSAEAHCCAGVALYLLGDALSASRALRAALTLAPSLWPAAYYAARAAESLGERALARAAYAQVVQCGQAPVPPAVRVALGDFEAWRNDVLALAARRAG